MWAVALIAAGMVSAGLGARPAVLSPAREVTLPKVSGRIDHFAYDPKGERLFVAALGNGSLEVVDLAKGERVRSVTGLKEPQGVAFAAAPGGDGTVAVACGGDGTLHLYDGRTLAEKAFIAAGDDADNTRIDEKGHLWVGVGDGALACFDLSTGKKMSEIALKAHPESFRLEPGGPRVFVNVPGGFIGGGGALVVADRGTGRVEKNLELKSAGRNFPMALDSARHRLYVGCRRPALLVEYDTNALAETARAECVGDADDVFVDGERVFVIGGDGAVDVFEDGAGLKRIESVTTRAGARTGMLVPERHCLYVAAPARDGREAEILEYRVESAVERPSAESPKAK